MRAQRGITYVEVLVAMIIMTAGLVPALQALQSSLAGAGVSETLTREHYAEMALIETVLAEPYGTLLQTAELSGVGTASAYSDPVGSAGRRLAYVAVYDLLNADADGDPFTVPDPDSDGDGNLFTGYDGPLWIRVVTEGSGGGVETLTSP